ncbi:glutaredoxin family protein [Cellulosilyticum sp. I15G10I2]|uniref:glutaredoxin family protein n=1 Tax=Cellulosilyticum sp. I15G10I2 TaxID=1892843 RepID=UPI00085C064F|nr:glutaredoxin [Cellulosilyticum sp. I15G10I2]
MKELVLYYFDGCPFCYKVRKFLEGKSIDITYKNIHTDDEAYNTLIKVGGKSQVPCLFINGNPLYESEDIITWFKNNA